MAPSVKGFDRGLAESLLGNHRFEEAESLVEVQLRSESSQPKDLFEIAELYAAHARHETAVRIYLAIVERSPDHLPSLGRLGDLAFRRGDFRAAADLFERVVKVAASPPHWAYVGLGNSLERLGEFEEAALVLERAPPTQEVLYRIALLKKSAGQVRESLDLLSRLDLERCPASVDALLTEILQLSVEREMTRVTRVAQELLDRISTSRLEFRFGGIGDGSRLVGELRDRSGQLPEQVTFELLQGFEVRASCTASRDEAGEYALDFPLPKQVQPGLTTFHLRVEGSYGRVGPIRAVIPKPASRRGRGLDASVAWAELVAKASRPDALGLTHARTPRARTIHGSAQRASRRREQDRRASHAESPRVLAFYLPQFHPIPENDAWWGRGFTEWTNVAAAKPQFPGHLQPRIPGALGFYDLRLPESASAQFDLARRYGIDGFCYYYYWFDGRRVLSRPLDDLAEGRSGPFPFCICWANEDWTRSWDGLSGEVLLAQNHSTESDARFIEDVAPLLRRPHYIRHEGKPLLLVYRAVKLADPEGTVATWRRWCRDNGIGEIYVCAVQSFGFTDPRPYGFDAAVEFPPHIPASPAVPFHHEITGSVQPEPGFHGKVFDYQKFAEGFIQRGPEPYTLHRAAFGAWDNTARRPHSGHVFHRFSVERFRDWVSANVRKAVTEQAQPLVFVNAWNEWAEGTYLEPDVHFGYELLEAVHAAKKRGVYDSFATYWGRGKPELPEDRVEPRERILLVGHDAHFHGAQTNLLNMGRALKRELDMDIAVLLVSGGELVPEYEDICRTQVIGTEDGWQDRLRTTVRELASLGTRKAICNTVVTGDVLEVLKEEGFTVISLVHELPGLIEANTLQSKCWRIAERADALVFASGYVAREFAYRYWPRLDKIRIAPQGIAFNRQLDRRDALRLEMRKELGLASDAPLVLGCGFGDTRKGIDLFIGMAAQVVRARADAAFVWVGRLDPTIATYLQSDIDRLGLHDRFRVTGMTADAHRYFAAADVFALTSREDPFPSVVMEAFDAGLPVAAFADAGGYVDIVTPETGALVPYMDVAAMAKVILSWLADETERARIGARAHEICREQFGYGTYLRRLLALLSGKRDAPVVRPSVSVIVPNYNYAHYLELRLRTIMDQTLRPAEIIVLDDASTDDSVALVEKMAAACDIPVRLVTCEQNSGNPFRQWAKGLEMATGDLVWIAEADDYCEPTLLETLARDLEDPAVTLAWTDSFMVDGNGQGHGSQYKSYYAERRGMRWHHDFRISGRRLIDEALLAENVIPNASAVVFRRTAALHLLEHIGRYTFCGDWWFWIGVARNGDTVYRATALNYHRRHDESVMGGVLGDVEKLLPEMIGFYQRAYEAMPELFSARARVAVLDRLNELYAGFTPEQQMQRPLAAHPALKDSYGKLVSHLRPIESLMESNARPDALLLVSDDVGADPIVLESLKRTLRRRYRLRVQALHQGDAVVEGASTLITFGIAAHAAGSRAAPVRRILIAGDEFKSLLGQLPERGVTLEQLIEAVRTADEILHITEAAPHALGRLCESLLKPLDRLAMVQAPVGTEVATETVFLGIGNCATEDTWKSIAGAVAGAARSSGRRATLRLLAWGDSLGQLATAFRSREGVEIVAVAAPPDDLWELGDVGVAPETDGSDVEFRMAGMPLVAGPDVTALEKLAACLE